MSPMLAMPRTTVRKMIGAITIFTRLMKVSPTGFIARAASGFQTPRSTPMEMATSTWKVRWPTSRDKRRGAGEAGGGTVAGGAVRRPRVAPRGGARQGRCRVGGPRQPSAPAASRAQPQPRCALRAVPAASPTVGLRAALCAALCAALLAVGTTAAGAQPARDSVGARDSLYATPALRALVAAAARQNALPPGLAWYQARVETEIGVVTRRPDGTEGVAAVEQVATALRWARDGRYEQRVLGYRTHQVVLSFSALGVLGSGWVTPVLYGNRLIFQGVTEVDSTRRGKGGKPRGRRDTLLLVHPLAEDRDPIYRYSGGDTVLMLRLGGRRVPIVRVRVEPTGAVTRRTGVFAGDIDLDVTRNQVV